MDQVTSDTREKLNNAVQIIYKFIVQSIRQKKTLACEDMSQAFLTFTKIRAQ